MTTRAGFKPSDTSTVEKWRPWSYLTLFNNRSCTFRNSRPPQPLLLYLRASGLRGVDLNLQVTLCVTGVQRAVEVGGRLDAHFSR